MHRSRKTQWTVTTFGDPFVEIRITDLVGNCSKAQAYETKLRTDVTTGWAFAHIKQSVHCKAGCVPDIKKALYKYNGTYMVDLNVPMRRSVPTTASLELAGAIARQPSALRSPAKHRGNGVHAV